MTTKRDFINKQYDAGWVTTADAALEVGRKPGGNIDRLMKRHGVRSMRVDGFSMYYRADLGKVPKMPVKGAISKEAGEYIDKQVSKPTVKQGELPFDSRKWVQPEKPEKTDAEKLDGVELSDGCFLRRNKDVGFSRYFSVINKLGFRSEYFTESHLIELSREIVRRIDGEKASKPDSHALDCAAYLTAGLQASKQDNSQVIERLKEARNLISIAEAGL